MNVKIITGALLTGSACVAILATGSAAATHGVHASAAAGASVPPASSHRVGTPVSDPSVRQQVAVRYVAQGEGNRARYRIRERLAGRDLDNDAVGETAVVTGTIALDEQGRIVARESQFTANLASLVSDNARRDNYVRTRVLRTDSFPATTLRITDVRGLPSPLPTTGQSSFQLVGDLTVKGISRATRWDVTATVSGSTLTGTAATRFTFADFEINKPRVAMVLTVADTIRLEYDFVMTRR
jgi:polyisoprenoid-binding protein YceI